MKPRLFWVLMLAFGLVIIVGTCGMTGFFTLSFSRVGAEQWQSGMRETETAYAMVLADYYRANGNSWAGVEQRLQAPPFGGPMSFLSATLLDTNGTTIADSGRMGRNMHMAPGLQPGTPIVVEGRTIATLVVRPGGGDRMRDETSFWRPSLVAFLQGGLIAATILGGGLMTLAWFFSRRFSRPLAAITAAAHRMAAGNLHVQVPRAQIHELDELSQTFNRMAQALAEADRLRRQMTADVAHELRTPLSIIRGRLEGVQDGVYQATPAEIEQLLQETAVLERLIEDLRLLALAEAGQLPLYPEPIDPVDVLQRTAANFADHAAAQGIRLHVDVPDDLPSIEADPQRLGQVLANLVTNALRYTSSGGSVTLRGVVQNGQTPPRMLLSVQDTGSGIAPEDLPHVFERFWRADRSRARSSGGSGLGLAITRQLVEAHGGTITVESTPGQGTTVFVALPLVPSASME